LELTAWLIYLAIGIPVGLLSGMLGIGGGSVLVPVFALLFQWQGFDRSLIMQMALGTSLACIILGNTAGARTHARLGSVHWPAVRTMALPLVLGSLVASNIAHLAPASLLKTIFSVFMAVLALQMLLTLNIEPRRALPGAGGYAAVGIVIGLISGLVGIGGAVFSIAFLLYCGVPMRTAAGTSAALGVPIAVAGTLGYIASGLQVSATPPSSLGYIHLPAWVGVSLTSAFFAPLGARLAHRLATATLKKVFIMFLLVLTARMAVTV
jgi:uncharacterized membrane protein YfcA